MGELVKRDSMRSEGSGVGKGLWWNAEEVSRG